jgi:hypothetical protein
MPATSFRVCSPCPDSLAWRLFRDFQDQLIHLSVSGALPCSGMRLIIQTEFVNRRIYNFRHTRRHAICHITPHCQQER